MDDRNAATTGKDKKQNRRGAIVDPEGIIWMLRVNTFH